MNKKYLSVILFSALMLGTTGTFTSCKDYDDDINNLQEQVDKIVADIDALQKAAGSYVTAVKYDAATGKLTVTGGNGETFQLPMPTNVPTYSLEVKDGKIYLKADGSVISEATLPATPEVPAAFNPELLAWGEDGYLYYGDIKIEGVQKPTLNASISEIQKDGEVIGYIITIGKDSAKFYVKTDLKSMVFIPDLYVDGIEAAEYGYLYYPYQSKYESQTKGEVDGNKGEEFEILGMYTNGIEYDYAIPTEKTYGEFNPKITVNYNINPTSAKIDEEGLKFINRNVEVISRAAGEESLIQYVSKSAKVEKGILSVGLKAQGSKIASKAYGNNTIESGKGNGENDATIFALTSDFTTMGDRDTIITSDYAMLYASQITPVAIAYADGTETEEDKYESKKCPGLVDAESNTKYELYTQPYRAAENTVPKTLYLAYNDEAGIDLLDKLCLHYTWDTNTSNSNNEKHKVMSVEEAVNTYGMKFEFNLVKYVVGTNKTHDSKYLDPTQIKNGKAIARIVDANGETMNQQGVSAIGRHPLVQVLVRDAADKIILDGYIKLEIVREVANKETDFFDKGNFNFGCTDDKTRYAMKAILTWDEFAYKVLETAAVTSKEEFNKLYKLDVKDGIAKQFKRTGELEYAEVTGTKEKVGKVKEMPNQGGTTTDVLSWELTMCDMQTVYLSKADEGEYTGSADHAKTIYVRYVRQTDDDAELSEKYPALYLPITIHVVKPEAAVQTRIPEYWYSDNMDHWYGSTWMGGQGVHVNVDQPYDGKFPVDFINNLNAPWKVWTLTSTNVQQPEFKISNGTFTSYTPTILSVLNGANGGYKYYFRPEINGKKIKGASGKEYTLSVTSDKAIDMCDGKTYTYNKDFTDVKAAELKHVFKATEGIYTNTTLMANGEVIAEIQNGRTATPYQNDPCIEYQNNTVAKDILNAYAHDDKESLTALIGITAYSSCNVVLSLSDNVYPARIQRPVDIEGKDGKTFTDAEANGSIINIIDLFNFNDWRDVVFVTENGTTIDTKNAWLFAYYNFKSVKADIDGITTTLGMGEGAGQDKLEGAPLLTSVSKEVKFSQVGGDLNPAFITTDVKADKHAAIYNKVKAGFGQIKYDNNNNNVKEFWVRIPVEFSYQWGDIKAYVDCKVIHTMGN